MWCCSGSEVCSKTKGQCEKCRIDGIRKLVMDAEDGRHGTVMVKA
eukprot:SAG31_NODE_39294_length_289_cov_1.063158_1_plen_44_part_10